jgi:cytidine deaminase
MPCKTRKTAKPKIDQATLEMLMDAAKEASKAAHCPYSGFHVGAAVLVDGKVFTGCNVESASFGLTVCAERVAIWKAVSEGHRCLEALACYTPDNRPETPRSGRMSCGACRQVMAEFLLPGAPVYLDGVGVMPIEELIPDAFLLETRK